MQKSKSTLCEIDLHQLGGDCLFETSCNCLELNYWAGLKLTD